MKLSQSDASVYQCDNNYQEQRTLDSEQLPLHSFPYQLLRCLMAQLSDQILSHVAKSYQLGIQEIHVHSLQEASNTSSSSSSSASCIV